MNDRDSVVGVNQTAEAAPRNVFEEDTLDRVLGAEGENLVELGLLERGHRPGKL